MDIVEEIRLDSEKGARRLEAEYRHGLMTLARRFCHDPGDAAELVNRTFAEVVANIDKYAEQSAFFGWMSKILVNLHSKDVRRMSNGEIVYPGDVPDIAESDSEESVYRHLDASLLRDAIETLPDDIRKTLMMHYFMDLSVGEIAKILSIPGGTVKWRLHYAREMLAAKLGATAEKAKDAAKKPGVKATLAIIALCALTAAAGIARWGELSERAAGRGRSPSAPQSAAIAAARPEVAPYLSVAPVPPDSPVASTPTPVPPDSPVPPVITASATQPSNRQTVKPSNSTSTKEQNMNKTLRSLAASAAFAAATAATTASGADWYVSPNGTGGGTSQSDRGDLMDVLYNGQIASGDTIHLATGTYNLDVSKSPEGHVPGYGGYLLAKVDNLSFIGESDNPEDVRLVGTPSDQMRIFVVYNGGCVLRNLLLTGGYTIAQGAGICIADALIGNPEAAFCASNCVVENCSAAYQGGGGFGGLWRDCVIRNNEARNKVAWPEGSAGGVFHAILHDCVITNNSAGFCGGGIAGGRQNGATDTARPICETRAYNCLIGWNRSVYGGGAAVAPESLTREYCQLFGCTIVGNAAAYDETGDGGGLGGGAYQCVVSNCVVSGNSSTRGNDSAFNSYGHNYGVGKGGGVMDCEVVDSTIDGNTCTGGGAGAANSDLTRCVLQGNSATGGAPEYANYGGGAYSCTAADCLLIGNSAGFGGGAFSGCLENCIVSNNQTTAYDGGAAYNASTRNCLVTGNRAHRYYALCKGTHYGTLVYGNVNGKIDILAASGIGADEGEAEAVAVNCTVWNNDNSSAQVSRTYMTNCIVNSVEYIPSAVNSFWRYGTVENQTGCISGEGLDPMFEGVDISLHPSAVANVAPAAYAIKPSSPCRDKGLTLSGQRNETDLLGNPRVKYEGVDMGALECVGGVPFTMVIR